MDYKKLFAFLQGLGFPAKVIVVIITLLAMVLTLFFVPACAYKLHVDRVDNLTKEISIKEIYK